MTDMAWIFSRAEKLKAGFRSLCLVPVFAAIVMTIGSLEAVVAQAGTINWYPLGYSFPYWPDEVNYKWAPFHGLDDGGPETRLSATPEVNFVGSYSYPGFYTCYRPAASGVPAYLFFRIRVAAGQIYENTSVPGAYTFRNCIWIYIDNHNQAGALNPDKESDYAIVWDSNNYNQWANHGLEMQSKTTPPTVVFWRDLQFSDVDGQPGIKLSYPGLIPGDFDTAGLNGALRTVDLQPSSWGDTTFIDIAVNCDYLAANTTLRCIGQNWNIQLGSGINKTDHQSIGSLSGGDIAGRASPDSSQVDTFKAINPSTAINLLSFDAIPLSSSVLVQWATASEVDNAGFNLWRADAGSEEYAKVNEALIPAEGSTAQGAEYSFEDTTVAADSSYRYKLEDFDSEGVSTFHGPVAVTVGTSVVTESPASGAGLSRRSAEAFSWESQGLEQFWIELSADPEFSKRLVLSTAVECTELGAPFAGSYTPTKHQWKKVLAKFGKKNRPVYWRVRGIDASGALRWSDAASFHVVR